MSTRCFSIHKNVYDNYYKNIELYEDLMQSKIFNRILKKFYNENDYDIEKMSLNFKNKYYEMSTEFETSIETDTFEEIIITLTKNDISVLNELSHKSGIKMKYIIEILIIEFNNYSFEERRKKYLL